MKWATNLVFTLAHPKIAARQIGWDYKSKRAIWWWRGFCYQLLWGAGGSRA